MATLGSLPVGSVVKSLNTKYNNAVIRFIVGHQDTANGRTKLVTERIITLKPTDAQEPNNTELIEAKLAGNTFYVISNISQWLNSMQPANSWYSPQHDYDIPPIDNYVLTQWNDYRSERGFLSYFDADFYNSILITQVYTVSPYNTVLIEPLRIYLLSCMEVGIGTTTPEGNTWSYFNTNTRRQCKPTAEAVSQSEYKYTTLNASSNWPWRLRSVYVNFLDQTYEVGTDGLPNGRKPYDGRSGIRPALELSNTQRVSDAADVDGAYILQWGQPPTTPSSISYGTPQAGMPLTITTGGSTDPEGKSISYVWEIKIDSGAYTQVGITSAKTITKTVPTSGTTYQARVKAVNSDGMESAYRTGAAKTINHNTPPVISGSDSNLGAMTTPVT